MLAYISQNYFADYILHTLMYGILLKGKYVPLIPIYFRQIIMSNVHIIFRAGLYHKFYIKMYKSNAILHLKDLALKI